MWCGVTAFFVRVSVRDKFRIRISEVQASLVVAWASVSLISNPCRILVESRLFLPASTDNIQVVKGRKSVLGKLR